MADRLYLSYWLRGFQTSNMVRTYEKLLRLFPFSQLSRDQSTLRVHAISFREPPLLEREFNDPLDIEDLLPLLREYVTPDTAYELETRWDLWQFDKDWHIQPVRVLLQCLGPTFEGDLGEQIRLEFGRDVTFLPDPERPESLSLVHSNIKSLLRLVSDLDGTYSVEKRLLWSEAGGNFAEKLQAVLRGDPTETEWQ